MSQREIKFRAWNKDLKQMKECFAISFSGNGTVGVHADNPVWFFEDIKIMQFTGLKDKNGKEIYEQDIVKYLSGEKHLVDFIIPISNIKDDLYSWSELDYEVIGNIYENSELLGQTKE